MERPSWDEYFIKMAALVAERSTCKRHNVGAIIVKDKRVVTTGYNGAPKDIKDCLELGCLRNELKIESGTMQEKCRAIHAEQNAIIQAGVHGVNINGGKIYCTHSPCIICSKMIINAGLEEVITYQDYPEKDGLLLLKEAGVEFKMIERPTNYIQFKD